MSDQYPHIDVLQGGVEEEAAAYPEGNAALDFLGFDMNIPRSELLETIEAWQGLIERMSRDAQRDARARELITRTRLRCGVAFCVLQDWDAARRELEQVRDAQDAHPSLVRSATWMLSTVYGAQGQYELAIACWTAVLAECEGAGTKKASKLPAQMTMLYLYRAQLYAEQGQYAEAVADCDRVQSYHPEWAEVFSVRGLAHANLGDMERALADCARSIELAPTAALCYRRRGVVHTLRKDYVSALADFDRALKLDPTDELARQGRLRAVGGYLFHDLLGGAPQSGRQDPEQGDEQIGEPEQTRLPAAEEAV